MSDVVVEVASREADFIQARDLFEEYARWLNLDLCFQGFAEELTTIAQMYANPKGCLFVARKHLHAVARGCVGVREFENHTAELKRLFVGDDMRGLGAGLQLTQRALAFAKQAGYERIVLDTLPSMKSAARIYEALGFAEIAPYYHNPLPGVRYLGLKF